MRDSINLTNATKADKQPSATKLAVDKIKQLIFTGELASDSNHLESELADRLGMSRTPVREATLKLQAHGLLEVQPRKGVKIVSITTDDLVYLFDALIQLECLAVKRVTQMGYTKSQLKRLFDADMHMRTATRQDDRVSWQEWDEEFHFELVRLSKNKYLEGMVESLNDQVRRVRSVSLHLRPSPTKSNKEHRELIQAMLKGDAENSQAVHRHHHERSARELICILEKSGLKRL